MKEYSVLAGTGCKFLGAGAVFSSASCVLCAQGSVQTEKLCRGRDFSCSQFRRNGATCQQILPLACTLELWIRSVVNVHDWAGVSSPSLLHHVGLAAGSDRQSAQPSPQRHDMMDNRSSWSTCLHIKSVWAACRDKDVVAHMWRIKVFITYNLSELKWSLKV